MGLDTRLEDVLVLPLAVIGERRTDVDKGIHHDESRILPLVAQECEERILEIYKNCDDCQRTCLHAVLRMPNA